MYRNLEPRKKAKYEVWGSQEEAKEHEAERKGWDMDAAIGQKTHSTSLAHLSSPLYIYMHQITIISWYTFWCLLYPSLSTWMPLDLIIYLSLCLIHICTLLEKEHLLDCTYLISNKIACPYYPLKSIFLHIHFLPNSPSIIVLIWYPIFFALLSPLL